MPTQEPIISTKDKRCVSIDQAQVFLEESEKLAVPTDCVRVPFVFASIPEFFPVGTGFFSPYTETASIMVITNHIGSIDEFRARCKGTEDGYPNKLWLNIKLLLAQSRIHIHQCYFTSAFPFLYNKPLSPTDSVPVKLTDEERLAHAKFLGYQIETIKPTLIVTLGIEPLITLSALPEFSMYEGITNFEEVDKKKLTFSHCDYNGITLRTVCLSNPAIFPELAEVTEGRLRRGRTGLHLQKELLETALLLLDIRGGSYARAKPTGTTEECMRLALSPHRIFRPILPTKLD